MEQALQGLRVIDFGWVWAGGVLGQVLADMGAEVIKMESKRRVDGMRLGKVFELGTTIEINPHFHNLHRNKLSVTVDIKQPKGAELVKRLARKSDVVIENFTPHVLPGAGLDYDSLTRVKPDIIMIAMSPTGQYGPLRDILAYAPIINALSGVDGLTGYQGENVLGLRHPYADPNASLFGAVAVLAALRYRKATGKGQYIDLSQWEATASLVGEAVMDYSMNGRVQGTQGNSHASMAPHGNYRCRGNDKWISIAVRTDEDWQGFCCAIDNPDWVRDERFCDRFSRLKNREELDKLVSQWTAQHEQYEATELLQKEGVAAMPVLDTEGVFFDPHFKERQVHIDVEHPLSGGEVIYGVTWKLSETPGSIRRHAPFLGEHNEYVFGEVVGLSKEEIDRLVDEKVIY